MVYFKTVQLTFDKFQYRFPFRYPNIKSLGTHLRWYLRFSWFNIIWDVILCAFRGEIRNAFFLSAAHHFTSCHWLRVIRSFTLCHWVILLCIIKSFVCISWLNNSKKQLHIAFQNDSMTRSKMTWNKMTWNKMTRR